MDVVPDEQLAACEFVQLVTEEGELEIRNGGPALPKWFADGLLKVTFVPLSVYRVFWQQWFAVPARVLGLPPNFSLFDHAAAGIVGTASGARPANQAEASGAVPSGEGGPAE